MPEVRERVRVGQKRRRWIVPVRGFDQQGSQTDFSRREANWRRPIGFPVDIRCVGVRYRCTAAQSQAPARFAGRGNTRLKASPPTQFRDDVAVLDSNNVR